MSEEPLVQNSPIEIIRKEVPNQTYDMLSAKVFSVVGPPLFLLFNILFP